MAAGRDRPARRFGRRAAGRTAPAGPPPTDGPADPGAGAGRAAEPGGAGASAGQTEKVPTSAAGARPTAGPTAARRTGAGSSGPGPTGAGPIGVGATAGPVGRLGPRVRRRGGSGRPAGRTPSGDCAASWASGPSQVGVAGAMRARDAARPTAADLAAAERDLVIVRRHYVPPDPEPR